ncbi:MAG: hypothetical protein V9H69_01120 [Anaerolineae bacterium]
MSTGQPAALTLVGPGGETLTQGAPAILRRLGAAGNYIVGVSLPAGAQPLWLNLDAVPGTPAAAGRGNRPDARPAQPGRDGYLDPVRRRTACGARRGGRCRVHAA